MNKITPFLWFDTQAGEAMEYYVSLFPNSKVLSSQTLPDGKIMGVSFILDGQEFMGINAGPEFKFNESISFYVNCDDQAEVDKYYDKLLADGGEESQCGWIKDKFGLWWQIIPKQLTELMGDPDPMKAKRVMDAMMSMKKIIIADLEKAHRGE